jgi:hypothetical protein
MTFPNQGGKQIMAERDFFDVMKETLGALAPGLKDFGPEVSAEMSRLGTQGAMEMAQALFNGAAFTPYGPGQYTPSPELDQGSQQNEIADQNLERERGGREM